MDRFPVRRIQTVETSSVSSVHDEHNNNIKSLGLPLKTLKYLSMNQEIKGFFQEMSYFPLPASKKLLNQIAK